MSLDPALVLGARVPQTELARRTGLTEKHVSEMMNGWSQGKLTAWQALLDAAGVHLPVSTSDGHTELVCEPHATQEGE